MFKPLIVEQEQQIEEQQKLTAAIKELENKIGLEAIKGSKPNSPIELKTIQIGNTALPKTWRIEQGKNDINTFNKKY